MDWERECAWLRRMEAEGVLQAEQEALDATGGLLACSPERYAMRKAAEETAMSEGGGRFPPPAWYDELLHVFYHLDRHAVKGSPEWELHAALRLAMILYERARGWSPPLVEVPAPADNEPEGT